MSLRINPLQKLPYSDRVPYLEDSNASKTLLLSLVEKLQLEGLSKEEVKKYFIEFKELLFSLEKMERQESEVLIKGIEKLICKLCHVDEFKKVLILALAFLKFKTVPFMVEKFLGGGSFSRVEKVFVEGEIFAKKDYFSFKNKMVEKEAKMLLLFSHPNILSIYFKENLSLFLEWVELGPLTHFKTHRTLTRDVLTKWLLQIIDGLSHMHSRGVIHGDLKEDNILITKDFNVKLSDFSSSFFAYEPYEEGSCSLSCFYSSPEYLSGAYDETTVFKIDVWSFGILLWKFLAKEEYQTPFVLEDHPLGIYGSLERFIFVISCIYKSPSEIKLDAQYDPKKISELDPDGTFRLLISQCLEPDPKKRISLAQIQMMLLQIKY